MDGDRGMGLGGGGRGPGPPPGKLQVVIYFQAETGTNFPREATSRWSCLDSHTHV